MPNYIVFDDNHPDKIMETWDKMVDEVKSAYFLPPTKKKVCVDIGTNIGTFIAHAHNLDAFEEIYGFEPAFQTYHTCLSMLRHFNVLGGNTQVRNLAVTEKSGQVLNLYVNDHGVGTESGNATLVKPPDALQVEHCMTIGLDDIFDILQVDYIDYLKMEFEKNWRHDD
jgi:FkbM family methyltransferase